MPDNLRNVIGDEQPLLLRDARVGLIKLRPTALVGFGFFADVNETGFVPNRESSD